MSMYDLTVGSSLGQGWGVNSVQCWCQVLAEFYQPSRVVSCQI